MYCLWTCLLCSVRISLRSKTLSAEFMNIFYRYMLLRIQKRAASFKHLPVLLNWYQRCFIFRDLNLTAMLVSTLVAAQEKLSVLMICVMWGYLFPIFPFKKRLLRYSPITIQKDDKRKSENSNKRLMFCYC